MTILATTEQVHQFAAAISAARDAGCRVVFDYCDGCEYNDPIHGVNTEEAPEFSFAIRGRHACVASTTLEQLGFELNYWDRVSPMLGSNLMSVDRGLSAHVKFPDDWEIHYDVHTQLGIPMLFY